MGASLSAVQKEQQQEPHRSHTCLPILHTSGGLNAAFTRRHVGAKTFLSVRFPSRSVKCLTFSPALTLNYGNWQCLCEHGVT